LRRILLSSPTCCARIEPYCGLPVSAEERMWSITGSRNIGSKETAMPTRSFERAQLLIVGCTIMFVAYVLIEHAQAQPGYVPPPTPLPPPVFNPSSPNVVPQPSYRPITPTTPSTVPSDEVTSPTVRRGEVTSPADEGLPRRVTRSHRRASVYGAGPVYRAGPIVTGPPPVAYSYVGHGYPCAWQRSWDGYWFRTSPCSW